ncbi:MAG: DJ-1/PfpI family protein [Candidatus Omnitrophica bacterium]|jgi:4-methyl-5(b-hydroxyethyl)-thiazole monophosphate biosynthesis|nr:DJ-1/PfpI family protein [Candidatus Omnitrophota bacterium]
MTTAKKVWVILAEGFEEIEAVTPIDVLRRAGLEVTVAGVGSASIMGAHGIRITADREVGSHGDIPAAIVLPGGMPGASNLAASSEVTALIRKVHASGGIVAAICASPAVVLAPLGLLDGMSATCYPGFEDRLGASVKHSAERVVRAGNVITSRGPGTALEFSLAIVEALAGGPAVEALKDQMVLRGIRV